MQLMRRQDSLNPFRELDDFSERFNRLLGLVRPGNGEQQPLALSDWSPACDITESDKDYKVVASLPNVEKDDVHVTLESGVLSLRGERKEVKDMKDVKYHRRELAYGSFVRSFTLPEDANGEKVDARFRDGTLTVTVPKSANKGTKAKEVTVQ